MRFLAVLLVPAICVASFSSCGGGSTSKLGKSAALVGSTTLFQAAEDPAMAEKLDAIISSGEDLNAKDSEGKTALHHAVSADNSAAVVKLVRANADPSIKDGQGRTAEELGEQEQKVNALQALDRAMIKAMRTRK